jgi:hypothetical protein
MKNYKAHTLVYSDSDPFYKVIVLRLVFLCIKDKQCYNEGELRTREVHQVKRENVLVSPA